MFIKWNNCVIFMKKAVPRPERGGELLPSLKLSSLNLYNYACHSLHPCHLFRLVERGLGRYDQQLNLFLIVFCSFNEIKCTQTKKLFKLFKPFKLFKLFNTERETRNIERLTLLSGISNHVPSGSFLFAYKMR